MTTVSGSTKAKPDKRHHYVLEDGTVLPRVTSILDVISKPALVTWAANVERELVVEAAAQLWEDVPVGEPKMSRAAWVTSLHERLGKERAHQKVSRKALDIGSQVHKLVEWSVRRQLGQEPGPAPQATNEAVAVVAKYEGWARSVRLEPASLEQLVWNRDAGYAGTLDLYGRLDGRPVVLDWKTSKAVYPEAYLQIAAYREALIWMGHADRACAGVIVRLPKTADETEPEVRLVTASECEAHFTTFVAALEVWKWQQGMKG